MKLYSEDKNYKLYSGSMLDILEVIEPNKIDNIITDPPYELNFMGKGWDRSGIAFQPNTWEKCFEVLKPGGYLLAFGGSRTFHRIACAIEDAGFEIRDTIMWLYGSGFPKSMNIGLAIDKKNGVENRTGEVRTNENKGGGVNTFDDDNYVWKNEFEVREAQNEWKGWGTALKPSFEPIIVARKPFKGSLVDNVIEYGVGGINIDECRVGNEELRNSYAGNKNSGFTSGDERNDKGKGMFSGIKKGETVVNGRFPANTILTYDETDFEEVCGGFPNTKGNGNVRKNKNNGKGYNCYSNYGDCETKGYEDSGSASRYFYCAKASKKDRDEGLDEFEEKENTITYGEGFNSATKLTTIEQKETGEIGNRSLRKNTHPTVKPTDLMQYLVRLVTPNGGTVLDPFNGSGSTGKAVMYENKERNKNYKYIGIELTEEYLPIAKARIEYVCNLKEENPQTNIFDFINEEEK